MFKTDHDYMWACIIKALCLSNNNGPNDYALCKNV